LDCAKACAEVIALSYVAAEKGNKNVVSDAGVAVMAAYGALKSAALNVYINIGAIKDADFVHERSVQLETLLDGLEARVDATYSLVKSRL
jgi:formiminotetrahydrofolate cyclodeaminase